MCKNLNLNNNAIITVTTVEYTKLLYKDIISLENLEAGLKRTKTNVSSGLDGETKTDITRSRLEKLQKNWIIKRINQNHQKN